MPTSEIRAADLSSRAAELGVVNAIYLAARATEPPRAVEQAVAVAGHGLEGDRYFEAAGTFSASPRGGVQLTLIDAAALEALEREHEIRLEPGASRRNLVTRGIDLNGLVGQRFRVGEVLCQGVRLCPPCGHLERLTAPGVGRGLLDRGGLRADVLESGTIRVGDPIWPEEA